MPSADRFSVSNSIPMSDNVSAILSCILLLVVSITSARKSCAVASAISDGMMAPMSTDAALSGGNSRS